MKQERKQIVYKITTLDGMTRVGYPNQTQWELRKSVTAPGNGDLCSPAYLHAYKSPLIAIHHAYTCAAMAMS